MIISSYLGRFVDASMNIWLVEFWWAILLTKHGRKDIKRQVLSLTSLRSKLLLIFHCRINIAYAGNYLHTRPLGSKTINLYYITVSWVLLLAA